MPLSVVLLLGSYDPHTKSVMYALKEKIAEEFSGTNTYAYLLEELLIFNEESHRFFVIAERWSEKRISIFIFTHAEYPLDNVEVEIGDENIEAVVRKVIREKYNVAIRKVPIVDKLRILAQLSVAIIVIREKEETRGGEVAELIYLILNNFADKVCLFKRENISLSSMLMEFLDYMRIPIRTYNSIDELIQGVKRYISYRMHGRKI